MSLKSNAEKHFSGLEKERQQYIDHWQEISRYFQPKRGKFLTKASRQGNKGKKVRQDIIDSTGTFALRTLASGMMSGATPHSRPWFRLVTPDPDMMDFAAVREWLEIVEQRMRLILSKANFYNAQHVGYSEMGLFGIGAKFMEEDRETVTRFYPLTAGEFYIAMDSRGLPSVFGRDMDMTVRQLVESYGKNVSQRVRNLYDNGNYEEEIRIRHYIAPNLQRDIDSPLTRDMPFKSIWYETGGDDTKLLKESGYKEFPVIAPRWHALDDEAYGNSPAMDALGDNKQLQLLQKRIDQAIGKQVNPAMIGPTSLRNQPSSIVEGSITYLDEVGNQSFRPAHEVRFDVNAARERVYDIQNRIEKAFYADLFLMMSQTDRRQITAREIDERHEEKMLALGPVVERLADEDHSLVIDRLFSQMITSDLVPEAPEELEGVNLKVEYISMLAQAQHAVGAGAIEQVANLTMTLGQAYPQALDKFDPDEAIEQYARMKGTPVKTVRDNETLNSIREQRAQQEQQAQMAQMAQGMAEGAKNLSQADMEGDNALTRMANG